MQIGLLSDTHGYFDPLLNKYFMDCDEIWHAGDIGTLEITEKLSSLKPIKAVFGNIDGGEIRKIFPRDQIFLCQGMKVFITHIGGYPGKYSQHALGIIKSENPGLFICGHSHILKVMPDHKFGLLHINPGSAGQEGFHLKKTIVRFRILDGKISNLEVVELGPRISSNKTGKI